MNTLSDELKEQEYLGYWWLPVKAGQSQDNRAGVIHFKPNQRAELDLLGSFEDGISGLNEPFKEYAVIQGAAHGMHRFTLFNGAISHRNSNLAEPAELASVRISFIDGWVGQEVCANKEAIQFFDFRAGMDGLAAWHNILAFDSKYDFQNQNTELCYKCPETLELYKDDLVEIELAYSWQGSAQSLAQCEGRIVHDPRIVIKSLNGKLPYYGERGSYHFYLNRVRTILGLMIGRGCPLYDCTGLFTKFEARKDGSFVREVVLRHLWRRDIEYTKPISPFDVWIPCADVIQHVKKVVERFMGMHDAPAGFAGHIVYMNASRHANFTQSILPELVYLFEGLHRELFCHAKRHLKERLNDEISRVGVVFPFLDVRTKDMLIEYVKGCRNAYSHANPDTNQGDFSMYIYTTIWMRMFLSAMLLEACGMPVADIYTAFQKNHEYQLIAAKLPPMLLSRTASIP